MFQIVFVLILSSAALAISSPSLLYGNETEKYYVSLIQTGRGAFGKATGLPIRVCGIELEFPQAYATCKKYGWTLATERNFEESAALNDTLKTLGYTSNSYWLGGFRQIDGVFNPIWMWIDLGEEINDSNWRSGEPTEGANCLFRGSLVNSSGQWLSRSCATEELFICQKF